MVKAESLCLEKGNGKNGEDRECDHLLDNFKLPEVKRPSVTGKAHTVGRYLEHVFKEGDAPADEDNSLNSQIAEAINTLELQMTIPGQGHKGIGQGKEEDGKQCFVHGIRLNFP